MKQKAKMLQLRAKFKTATVSRSRFEGSQIPVLTEGFKLRTSYMQWNYLTH